MVEQSNDLDRLTDTINPEDSFVPMLGIMGATLTTSLASQVPSIRFPVGVVVAARAAVGGTADVSLVRSSAAGNSVSWRSMLIERAQG